ncbi:DUF4429 domain-containing protein [Nonomuraea sp. PA05]|uniref:DUF4429 domain-containing protein n=1 Tax=Nonomuraea sp. PA05 TaxID=2604466 RepID=UPI0011D8620F|nr:DUF4429 domain-containing protein [Nonomuraea sp. PA05]TYB67251.1 DUF4429 domain-containing protein [Nonomuraea sp. PA05]
MEDVLAGLNCTWAFGPESLTITPGQRGATRLVTALGVRVVPYAALADVALTPGRRRTVVLRLVPRQGADPVLAAAAGQLKAPADPFRLVLPAAKETLADYYADKLRSALTDRGPADRFLIAAPPVPLAFKGWDGAASFDGDHVTFTWFWSGASSAKYSAGDQRFSIAELEGVEWHAPEGASGSLRLKVRGRRMPSDPNKDPASVIFSLGWGATHKSLPFAAAVLAAVPSLPRRRPIAARGLQVAELIAKLGELRDAGVLTEEEFQAKKAELLARL